MSCASRDIGSCPAEPLRWSQMASVYRDPAFSAWPADIPPGEIVLLSSGHCHCRRRHHWRHRTHCTHYLAERRVLTSLFPPLGESLFFPRIRRLKLQSLKNRLELLFPLLKCFMLRGESNIYHRFRRPHYHVHIDATSLRHFR